MTLFKVQKKIEKQWCHRSGNKRELKNRSVSSQGTKEWRKTGMALLKEQKTGEIPLKAQEKTAEADGISCRLQAGGKFCRKIKCRNTLQIYRNML